jgi:hypothetical protein
MPPAPRADSPPVRADRYDFLLAAAALAAIGLAHASYVPMWDGAIYLRCLVDAFDGRAGATFLFCANHPTGGYLSPLALAFHLSGMRYPAVIAANVVLAALAAHSVADLSALMLPGAQHRAERALVTLGFALSPLLVACAVQLTPDFGVAVFALCTVRALARERPGLAALFGALTCLSKETGGVIYVLSCAAYLLVYVAWSSRSQRPWLGALRRHAVLAAALVPSALWLATRLVQRGDRAAWQGVGTEVPIWRQLLSVSWLDNVLPSQLAEIFVLNFGWVLSAFVLAHALDGARRWIVRAPPRDLDLPGERAARFVTFAFLGTVFAVTRIRTFVIPRYVLPAVVFLPLLGQLALHALGVQRRLRLLVLGLFAALSALAIFRSQDGLSMQALGSFPFGTHRLIDVTAWTHETPSRRDHAVYNLEFTHLARLLDDALPHALADGRHALALNRHADWWLIGCVDPGTRRRVICTPSGTRPALWTLAALRREAERPPLLYYLELPGMDDEDELIGWSQRYRVGEARTFARGGYAISLRELRLRVDAPAPER